MDKISKARLIKEIAEELGTQQSTVKLILLKAASKIGSYIENGQAVEYPGIGKFYPRDRKARTMVCPFDKEEKEIPAKRVLSFKATKKA